MRILMTILFVFSTTAFAEISREEASYMIDQMVKSNTISPEEAVKAKARLGSLPSEKWTVRMPASVSIAEPSTDLVHEQFAAIENDLRVLAPEVVVPQVEEKVVRVPANVPVVVSHKAR